MSLDDTPADGETQTESTYCAPYALGPKEGSKKVFRLVGRDADPTIKNCDPAFASSSANMDPNRRSGGTVLVRVAEKVLQNACQTAGVAVYGRVIDRHLHSPVVRAREIGCHPAEQQFRSKRLRRQPQSVLESGKGKKVAQHFVEPREFVLDIADDVRSLAGVAALSMRSASSWACCIIEELAGRAAPPGKLLPMLDFAICHASDLDAGSAGSHLAECIGARRPEPPDAMLIFAAPDYAHAELLQELQRRTGCLAMIGCTSAGEFTNSVAGEGLAVAVALWSDQIRFTAVVATGLEADHRGATSAFIHQLTGLNEPEAHKTAILFIDALAGVTESFLEMLVAGTAAAYQFVGGGAGDNARFQSTKVFAGTQVHENAAVGLELVSRNPIGIGVQHGWVADGPALRVTDSSGGRVKSLNGVPAFQVFESHAAANGQTLDPRDPMPYFLHHVLGIVTPTGLRLRVPLSVTEDGAIDFAAAVPSGRLVHIMRTDTESTLDAAAGAAAAAIANLGNLEPKLALFFDCVATRLRMPESFPDELGSLAAAIPAVPFAGFNTHGQVARAEGQFSGFHNCTAVVCLIPD